MIGAIDRAGELHVETPEGVDLTLRPAGPIARGLALAIDLSIRFGINIAVWISLAFLGALGFGTAFVVAFLLEWFYPVAFEVLANGRTPGKRSLGLVVVNADATPVGLTESLLRNLLIAADFLPLFYFAGVAAICSNERFQRLGDLAAGTLVVHSRELDRSRAKHLDQIRPRVSPVPLRSEEQLALFAFAERLPELSEARGIELADILTDLSGASGPDGVRELLRIGRGVASDL